ncbi:hypothetical protein L226DRAFT_462292 [Lentinus tigrinus ALCF2SS1-7]|uniref:Tim44-like domain-containing protein n=1 Tax=Lentinus tigrinus ALCF2SS1-6 TaxID=1328759 RepID=A0A5C2SE54_9APHY|nr:hypothetical protein L227DRAFT_500251 [Lentinus tigrinus ALCF2SS1-6]RPD75695.1 hypothetical protein L226DRAFT_462292 [Lentinus tigrinus ALCF2SS1-7]
MSLHASRKCLDVVGRVAGSPSSLSRTWSATLLLQHRCYTGKALTPQKAAEEDVAIERTTEDELKSIEALHRMTETNEMDISSAPLELLDVHVPTWRSSKEGATLFDHLRAIRQTQRNWLQNIRAMYQIAKEGSIPGVKVKSAWSLQLFATQSTKPDAWMAPFRQAALEVYKQVNEAVAARDEKTIKALTGGEQQLAYIKLIRSQDPRYVNVWKFHGERTPCRVVSLRSLEAYYGAKAPRMGSRLAVQAVVRFDTLQSVETYSKKTGARVGESQPKPVVEYLVFQKRMWFDSPWVIRDRLYEGLESRFSLPH